MKLFPAIDLRGGRAVRLLQGDYEKMTVYSDSPLDTAKSFERAGAEYLHLVDLDGAKDGGTPNFELIRAIAEGCSLKIELGGGIRSLEVLERYLDLGLMRVILGTSAVTDPDFLKEALALYGNKIAVGVDMKNGRVATHGWTQLSELSGEEFCKRLQDMGVQTLICTDISRDGALRGINEELYRSLSSALSIDIIASGGVTEMDDLFKLSRIGVAGAVLGKAIYTGGINLKKSLEELKRWKSNA